MDCSNGSWMTVIIVLILLPAMYASPIPPGNNTNSTTELLGNQSKDDCLANQFFDIDNKVCVDCTYCHPGEEHSSQQKCGYGEGVSMTCKPCDDEYYQTGEGYSQLKCRRCVTCDHLSEILQECTPTQDRQCGPCPENYYEFLPNVCLECTSTSYHADCARTYPTPEPPKTNQSTARSSSNSSPASLETLPTNPLSSSLPSQDSNGTTGIPKIIGSVTVKDVLLGFGIGGVICIILICIVVIIYKQCAGTPSAGSTTTRDSASYKSVATISKDQPSTSSAADPATECTPGDVLPGQPLLQQEREQPVRVSQPDTRSVDFPSSEVNNEYLSTPGALSISGGDIRRGIRMYPHLGQGDHVSPDSVPESPGSSPSSPNSPQVNLSFEF